MFSEETLSLVWFVLLWGIFASYLVLDGFDFGVGIAYIFGNEEEKCSMRQAIGPFWDGNETWFVLFAGVMFAAFPTAYGMLLSHFYVYVFLLLFSLIFRGASLEFRSMVRGRHLKWFWDIAFWLPSLLIPIIFGVVASDLALGKVNGSVDEAMHSVLVCVCLLSLLTLHGMNFLKLKGVLFTKLNRISHISGILFIITWPWIAAIAPISHPLMYAPILFMTCFAVFMWWGQNKTVQFILSWIAIMLVVAGFAMLIYPVIGVTPDITIYDSMSSDATLSRMLMFAVIGLPFVCVYTFMSYRIFWKS